MGIRDWLRLSGRPYRSGVESMSILKIDGERSLAFYCGELPVDEAIRSAGHEPNGYFWEGVVSFLRPDLVERLELDSEAGMFSAFGSRPDLVALRGELRPLLKDPALIGALLERAGSEEFEFDD
jgi:hypothetical protein